MCISKTINRILKHIYLIFEKFKLCTTEFSRISKLRGKTKGKYYYFFSKWLVGNLKFTHHFIDGFI